MKTIQELNAIIERQASQLPLSTEPLRLYQPIAYIMEDGGKRLRPMLLLLAANLYSDKVDNAVQAAVGVEVFHNFTLLHDDIMDQAPVRRGMPTVHKKWGTNVAILSGDAMLIVAYKLISQAPHAEQILGVFNTAALQVCEGQQWDMDFEDRYEVTLQQYIDMICLKTSVLMAASLEMGAIIGGATARQCQSIHDFGINLGLAFQIQDDLLDTYAADEKFGKKIGGDIEVGKKTFLHIVALQRADANQSNIIRNSRSLDEVRAVYDQLGVPKIASEAISSYFDKAIEQLSLCHEDPKRLDTLRSFANSLVGRTR